MTRAHKLNIAGKAAIIAALMGGSSLSFAQDAAPMATAPASPAPVAAPAAEPIFTPPAVVRTLPTENDVVNAAAAQEAAAETTARREPSAVANAPAKPRTSALTRAATALASAQTDAVAPDASSEMITEVKPPLTDAIGPAGSTIEDAVAVAPVSQASTTPENSISSEDLTLVGGIAAALGAVGLGAVFASRRRRKVVIGNRVETVNAEREYVAPQPIRDDPAFQRFAAAPTPERVIHRAPITTRPDVPVTDPLFSTPVIAGPITDPLFAPRNDVEIPITDPLFAKHDRYVGRAAGAHTTQREPEPVN